ncbi:hypothetical protein PTTG_30759, partial [Puccinia triticina 1-1 BBBD Race 1]
MDLLKSYLEQVISSFRVVQKFLPWKEILTKHSDSWNPYTERKHIKVLEKNKQPAKESKERDPKKPYKIPKIRSIGIKAETLRTEAEERREQMEGNLLHGPSPHGSQGRDRGIGKELPNTHIAVASKSENSKPNSMRNQSHNISIINPVASSSTLFSTKDRNVSTAKEPVPISTKEPRTDSHPHVREKYSTDV